MNRYINIFSISIFSCRLTISIGNPMWFINEYKKIKEVNRYADIGHKYI